MYNNLFYLSCCCGRQKQYHSGDALLSTGTRGDKWEVSKHSVTKPTNAYGELEFQGAGQVSRAKVSSVYLITHAYAQALSVSVFSNVSFSYQYIRVSHDTDPEMALRLLCKEWKLDLPKLLISVTGGAKNFVLHPKLKQVLRKGLLKVNSSFALSRLCYFEVKEFKQKEVIFNNTRLSLSTNVSTSLLVSSSL